MLKRIMAACMALMMVLSLCIYAEVEEITLEETVTETETVPTEEEETNVPEADVIEEATVENSNSDVDINEPAEDEENAEVIGENQTEIAVEEEVKAEEEIIELAGFETGFLGNEIDVDEFTDDMSSNDTKYECINFVDFSGVMPAEASDMYDTTTMCPGVTNSEGWVIYKAAGERVFLSVSVVNYIRDGGSFGKVFVSGDGETYTDAGGTWTNRSFSGGPSGTDAYWNATGNLALNFSADDEIKYIKFYEAGEDRQNKMKLGDITLTSVDPTVPRPDPEAPADYGNEIAEDEVIDELETYDYMFDKVNLAPYDEVNPGQMQYFTDQSLLGLPELNKEAYMIYKAADGRVFTGFELVSYTRDQNPVVDSAIYASKDGWEYKDITGTVITGGSGGSGANDGGWSAKRAFKMELDENEGYRYIKVYYQGINQKQKFKYGSVTLRTTDVSVGRVTGDVYTETFDDEMKHISSSKGITAANGSFGAAAGSELCYQAMPMKALTGIEFTADGWNGEIKVMDLSGAEIEVEIEPEINGATVSAVLPSNAAYVKIISNVACTYTAITVSSGSAGGSEWVYIADDCAFTAELGGSIIETMQSGCTVSFDIPVKNAGTLLQKGKAYMCLFEGDKMVGIEEFTVKVKGGEKLNVTGSMEIATVTDETHVTLFLWTDLEKMVPFGAASDYGNNI